MLCIGSSSLPSVNGSRRGRTEEGETGTAHFIGTTGCLASDAESTVLLDFVVAADVSDRCRVSLMRSSNSSFPPVQSENPLFCAAGELNSLRSKQMALLVFMWKGTVFVSGGGHRTSSLSHLCRLGISSSQPVEPLQDLLAVKPDGSKGSFVWSATTCTS